MIIGLVYALIQTIFSVYLVLKTRNRFKANTEIVDIVDLANLLYGPGMKLFV